MLFRLKGLQDHTVNVTVKIVEIYKRSRHFDINMIFFCLLYLELGFLSVAYLTVANLARLGISVHC